AGVAEDADVVAVVRSRVDVEDLLVALLGRAPDLQVHEVVDDGVGPVLRDLLRHLAVVLVALRPGEVIALELIVLEHRLVVAADEPSRHLLGARRALVAERPARGDRRRRIDPVHLTVDRAVGLELSRDFFPRLLRNDQDSDAELRHDRQRLWRDRRRIGEPAGAWVRARTDLRGAGRIAARGCLTKVPSYSQKPVSRPPSSISADSVKRCRDSSIERRKPAKSRSRA